jgi:threonine dehydrogenase-like Zn-dependent dehydrogenase
MNTVKSVVFHGSKRVVCEEFPFDGTAGPGEIAGRTLVTLVSPGTELNSAFERQSESPGVGGYAAIVEIDTVGAGVTHLKPGDRVFTQGGHRARYRGDANMAIPVPAGLASEQAVFCRLAGVSWTTLVSTKARPHDRVVVVGLGLVGNIAAQMFASAGYRVTALDIDANRRDLAVKVGLPDVRASIAADDKEIRGQAAMVIDCTGHEAVVVDACRMVRKGGEVVLIGVPWKKRSDATAFELVDAVFHKYVVLRSGWEWSLPRQPQDFAAGSIVGNYRGALDWLAEERIKVIGLATIMSPANAPAAYDGLFTQSLSTLSVIFDWA